MPKIEVLAKKRECFLGLPITFTTYKLVKVNDEDIELHIKSGLISVSTTKVKLYKVTDVDYNRGFFDFFFGVGNLVLKSNDKSSRGGTFYIDYIHGAKKFAELIEDYVMSERKRMNVTYREVEVM